MRDHTQQKGTTGAHRKDEPKKKVGASHGDTPLAGKSIYWAMPAKYEGRTDRRSLGKQLREQRPQKTNEPKDGLKDGPARKYPPYV